MADDVFIIENAVEDERFSDNPLVTEGPEPRKFGPEQSILLHDLSKIVIRELVSQQAAAQDALTGIHNRRGFEVLAQKSMASSARYGWKSALVFLDLNKFKEINDTYGIVEYVPKDHASLEELISAADELMYHNKQKKD
jgi:GGDEF domain-containing protein